MVEKILLVYPGQEKRIVKAYHNQRGCHIKVHKLNGEIKSEVNSNEPSRAKFVLSASQDKKYHMAPPGTDVKLPFTYQNLHENSRHSGGFIPLILAALASSVAGGLIERGIAGSGIHKFIWHTGDHSYHLTPSGNGIHLTPWRGNKNNFSNGRGLYLNPYKGHVQPASQMHIKHLPLQSKRMIRELITEAIHE